MCFFLPPPPQHMMLLLEQSTTTTSTSFVSCCSPTCWKPESVLTWHLTSSPGRGAKLAWYHPEGCNFLCLMGQECPLANSLGSHVACYIFINSSDISPLLIAISPTCSKDTWKATVGSEVWASSGLPLRLPCPKDTQKKKKKSPPLPPAKLWPPPMNGCSLVGGHWYMLSSSRRKSARTA